MTNDKARRKDMRARGKLNAQWDKRMKKANRDAQRANRRAQHGKARENVGCAVVALALAAATIAALRARGMV